MGWFNNLAAYLAQLNAQQATAPTTTANPTEAAAPADAGSPGGMLGEDPRRNSTLEWAPDYSSFIDRSQNPNAVWMDAVEGQVADGVNTPAGWYTPGGENSDGAFGPTPIAVDRPDYWSLKNSGQWDLNDPNSNAWKFLQSRSDSFGRGSLGNVQEDPTAFYYGLREAGLLGGAASARDARGLDQVEASYREALEGFDPEFVDALVKAARDDLGGYWEESKQHEDSPWYKEIGDVLRDFRSIITLPPMAAALGAYAMTPAGATGSAAAATALPGQGMLAGLGPVGGAAAMGAGNAALQGGNLEQILRAGVLGGAKSYAGGAAFGGDAPTGTEAAGAGGPDIDLSSGGMISDAGNFFDAGYPMPPAVADPSFMPSTMPDPAYSLESLARGGAVPMSSTPAGMQTDPFTGAQYSQPAMTTFSSEGMLPQVTMPTADVPMDWAGFAANVNAPTDLDEMDAENREALEAGDTPPQPTEQSGINPRTVAKIALAVNDLLGSQGTPEGAPTLDQNENEGQFAEELADYMGLDAQTLADQGLTPGTEEYYQYLMSESDRIIAEALEGTDANAEDYSEALRGKTQSELQQLQRALYVRGQLDLMMGSGTYTDPFTGIDEEVIAPEGEQFNPYVGAYQRGVARTTDELAGLRGDDAVSYLNDLLGRSDVDLFGMQGAQDAEFERAKLEENDEMRRRRRGMLSY